MAKKSCPLCDGTGRIREGHVNCPKCRGKGKLKVKSAALSLCARCGAELEKSAAYRNPVLLTKSLADVAASDADPGARENALRAIARLRTEAEYGSPLRPDPSLSLARSLTAQRLSPVEPRTPKQLAVSEFHNQDDPRIREAIWDDLLSPEVPA